MTLFDRLERRFSWLAFPGFLRFYALFHILVFVLQLIQPEILEILKFDRGKIFSGEVWRVGTMFISHSQFGKPTLMNIALLIFAINFLFMVSDGLEEAWGAFKASLFYYTGMLLILAANFLHPGICPVDGVVLFTSAFVAFATLFPKTEILLFFVIPVQIRYLGMIAGGFVILNLIASPFNAPFYLMGYANYVMWAGIPALRGTAKVLEAGKRRRRFNAHEIDPNEAFHTCITCRRNDIEDPEMEFRIGEDGQEYCTEHLPPMKR
jgi:hypothetical protein